MIRFLRIFLVWAFLFLAVLLIIGRYAVTPNKQVLGAPQHNLALSTKTLLDSSGQSVATWYHDAGTSRGIVLLLHGVRSDRRSMLRRYQFLSESGYSVVLIDLHAHGESSGRTITFGHLESKSVSTAMVFIRQAWPNQKVAVIGSSLGGAAAILAADEHQADAYVLEAVFSTFRTAIENRLRIKLGDWSTKFSPLLIWQAPFQIGVSADELSPQNAIKHIQSPVLIISGEKDERATPADTQNLFLIANEPKTHWQISGAAHQDFYRFAPEEYSTRILKFLAETLQ